MHLSQVCQAGLTITSVLPTHSSEKSTPPLVISASTSAMGLLYAFGFRKSVAPKIFAFSNFLSLISTAKMREAPAFLQPMTAARPTAPSPNTAHTEPGVTFPQTQINY